MEIPLEKLIEIVVSRVLAELARRGVTVTGAGAPGGTGMPAMARQPAGHGSAAHHEGPPAPAAAPGTRLAPDFGGYKTPVLNENRVRGAGPHIREIVVPPETIVTAGARALIEQRRLKLTFTSTHS